jgi:hypothetical protein
MKITIESVCPGKKILRNRKKLTQLYFYSFSSSLHSAIDFISFHPSIDFGSTRQQPMSWRACFHCGSDTGATTTSRTTIRRRRCRPTTEQTTTVVTNPPTASMPSRLCPCAGAVARSRRPSVPDGSMLPRSRSREPTGTPWRTEGSGTNGPGKRFTNSPATASAGWLPREPSGGSSRCQTIDPLPCPHGSTPGIHSLCSCSCSHSLG